VAGAVERRRNAHTAWCGADALVRVGNDVDPGIDADGADTPGSAFAEKQLLGCARRSRSPIRRGRPGRARSGGAKGRSRILPAADTGLRRNPDDLQLQAPAAAVSPSAARLRLPGGTVGSGVCSTGFLRRGSLLQNEH
jgi:hypothetical protein